MNKPKRHHFVPRFLLSNFSDEKNMIWVFDRKTKKYLHQNIENTAVQTHYYRIRTKDGGFSTEVEDFFSLLETNACTAINKLLKHEVLSAEQKGNIALFVAFQHTRVPDFEKRINELEEKTIRWLHKRQFYSVEATKAILETLKEKNGANKKEVSPEKMYTFIQEERYNFKFPRERSIKTMLKIGYHTASYFSNMDWFILRAPNNTSFITSDNPYTLVPPTDYDPNNFWKSAVGILTPGAKKVLPLSTDTILIMGEPGEKIMEGITTKDKVLGINVIFARTSDGFIFAKDEMLLRSIVKKSSVEEIPFDREKTRLS